MAMRLEGYWWFLPGDLKDCVKLNDKDDVGSYQGTYPEKWIKIRHDLAKKG